MCSNLQDCNASIQKRIFLGWLVGEQLRSRRGPRVVGRVRHSCSSSLSCVIVSPGISASCHRFAELSVQNQFPTRLVDTVTRNELAANS